MGYIEQTEVGNVYITDINDWFATLSNLNRECKNYIDSEIRYKEILAEHDKQIKEKTINNFIVNAITEFQKFDEEHGYPTLGNISIILREVEEQLKKGE